MELCNLVLRTPAEAKLMHSRAPSRGLTTLPRHSCIIGIGHCNSYHHHSLQPGNLRTGHLRMCRDLYMRTGMPLWDRSDLGSQYTGAGGQTGRPYIWSRGWGLGEAAP